MEESSESEQEAGTSSDDSLDHEAEEDYLYANLLACQDDSNPKSVKENTVEALIDKDTKALLRACSHLRVPTIEEVAPKQVLFGEKTKLKTLILDMDETMIHSNFYPVKDEEI